MHVHSARLILAVMLAGCSLASCRRSSSARGPAASSGSIASDSGVGGAIAQCGSRPRCAIYRRQPVVGVGSLEVLVLRLAQAPDAGSDEDRCDQREYWLVRPQKSVLLARDCERQWGADNPGPAETHVDGTRLSVKYVEFQSSDGCEVYEATVQLFPLAIEKQARWQGTVRGDRCEQRKRIDRLPPAGDGSITSPVLVLHI